MAAVRCLLVFALTSICSAHVGSPDVFYEGSAGPYRLLVTVRPPQVVPGVAEVEIRSDSTGVRELRAAPVPLTGPAAQFPPTPDILQRSKEDAQFYTGSVWLMACCSWQVRIYADGAQGKADMAVPVVGVATRTLQMQKTMGAALLFFLIVLACGAVAISGAYAREGQLEPGLSPNANLEQRGRRAMVVTGVLVTAMICLGKLWWDSDDNAFQRFIYKPLKIVAAVEPGDRLSLRLEKSGWLQQVDDLLPDHNHLMHMYLIRLPEMERVWHLHPEMTGADVFTQNLPALSKGRYQIFADIVHASGLPETLVARLDLPETAGHPLTGDDAGGAGPPLSSAPKDRTVAELSGGYRMIWARPSEPLSPRRLTIFQFRVEDPGGKPATDMELYMGMQGHAAFVKSDGSVFAHIHTSGTVSMAALALTRPDPDAGHAMGSSRPASVSFPYALPATGTYRMIVQIKRAGRVETAIFDLTD